MKLKPIYGAYEHQKKQEQKQERLREKYHAGKGKTVVVHREGLLPSVIHLILSAILWALATIGLFCLSHPDTRSILFDSLRAILHQIT